MATATDVALDHYSDRQSLVDATGEVAGQMWSQVNPNRIADSWAEQLPELTSIVSGAQLGAARQADRYTTDALDAEGVDPEAVAAVDPSAFSGTASDGRGLMALLANPVVVTLMSIQDGMDVVHALGAGRSNLDMMVRTQVADAGRAADQVSLTTRPQATGYVRVAVGNSCARCLILSGRFYQWNAGFQRHPRCDCVHLVAGSARARFASDPRQIYDRLTPADRTRAGFTRADQRAIADGADLGQVVNAHRGLYTAGGHRFTTEGTTKRGFARSRLGKGKPRITPDEIYRAAGDDRDEALRLLHRNGYLLDEPAAVAANVRFAVAAPGAGGVGAVRLPPLAVRPLLASADSVRAVERAFETEARRISARRIRADFGRANLDNAREFAEGGLRVLGEFPDVELRLQVGRLRTKAMAETDTRSGQVTFAHQYAEDRDLYARAVARSNGTGFHRRAMATPAGTAVHESIHAVHFQYNPLAVRRKASRLMEDLADKAGLDVPTFVRRELGDYALEHMDEAIAQGVADAMVSGAPTELSRGILQVMRDQYQLGRMHVPASALRQVVDHSGLTVPQLRVLARTRGVAIPARAKKADIVRLLDESPPRPSAVTALDNLELGTDRLSRDVIESLTVQGDTPEDVIAMLIDDGIDGSVAQAYVDEIQALLRARAVPVAAPTTPRLATMKVADLRILAAERGITLPPRALKADIVKALEAGPATPLTAVEHQAAQRVAQRAAARERNRLIESSQGTARLLAEVDELVAKKADLAAIRQRLDPALIAPEQVFGGADRTVLDALRKAVNTGDVAKVRSAITRASTKAKLKPISRAGTKVKFDPELMEGVGGLDIQIGAQVVVVRRGATVTLSDGSVVQLTKAQVTTATPRLTAREAPWPTDAARTRDLEAQTRRTPSDVRQLGGGYAAKTDLLTYPDGSRTVRKIYGERVKLTKAEQGLEATAEELGTLIVDAFGVRSAAVVRTGRNDVLMEFIDGQTAAERWPGLGYGPEPADLRGFIDSGDGRLMGLADYVMGHGDRNEGNWIITADGRLAAIDHGFAFASLKGTESPVGFFTEFLQDPSPTGGYQLRKAIDVHPGDLTIIRERIEALRSRFESAGRISWYNATLRRLKELEKRAAGTKLRLAVG